MRVIEVYYDNKDGLVALDYYYNNENGKAVLNNKISGDKVKLFLDKISANKDIRGRRFIDGTFESIVYDNFCVKIYDYKFIREYCLLQEYVNKVDEYIRRKKNNVSSKVKRVNKYRGQKVVAGSMVLLLLFTTIKSLNSKLNSADKNDVYNSGESYVVSEMLESSEEDVFKNSNFVMISPVENEDENREKYVYIDYEDRSDSEKTKNTRALYGEMIEKYASMYGLDADLVIALATQERGVHSSVMDPGGATGLMQIQNEVWVGYTLSAYNFQTGKMDYVNITKETIADCEMNIKIGCMILQDCMKKCDYNILLGVQAYNMGPTGAKTAVTRYAENLGCSGEDIIRNLNDCGWLGYRDGIIGDTLYVEHVLSYVGSDAEICVYKTDGTKVDCSVKNYQDVKKR